MTFFRFAILSIAFTAALAGQQKREIPTADQVRAQLPPGVGFFPDIAYDTRSEAHRLDLFLPPEGSTDSTRPAIVIVHGGAQRDGDKRGRQWSAIPAEYAADGYVAISVNYRLLTEAPSPAQIEDVKCAVRWLRANAAKYGVDPQRIGAYGNSGGAHLVAMLGLANSTTGLEGDGPYQEHSSAVQAVCASAAPTDFLHWGDQTEIPDRMAKVFFVGPAETVRDRARQASPITYVRADAPPFLLIHGTADALVPISQSERFAKALRDAGARQVRYMILDAEGHDAFQSQKLLTYPAMKAFFDAALGLR